MQSSPAPMIVEDRPPVHRALSIAVQYRDKGKWRLDGTHHDPIRIYKLLKETYSYKDENIKILMDDDSGKYDLPTRENILKAMHELVRGAQPGDNLVFHFSGHGAQVPNLDGTEKDGFDEVIFPMDIVIHDDEHFENYIIDDDIHDILAEHLQPGIHVMMVFDCCHSGTAADLPFCTDDEGCPQSPISDPTAAVSTVKSLTIRDQKEAVLHEHTVSQGTDTMSTKEDISLIKRDKARKRRDTWNDFPDVTSWSACTSAEVTFEVKSGGLFIRAFTEALRKNPHPSHEQLMVAVNRELNDIVARHKAKRSIKDEGSTASADSDITLPVPQFAANHKLAEAMAHEVAI